MLSGEQYMISIEERAGGYSNDLYVLARLAIWAGDLEQAIDWLDQLLAEHGFPKNRYPDELRHDEIGIAASRVRRQAVRLRNEVERTWHSRHLFSSKSVLREVLSSPDWFVRATVWQDDLRHFRLLVYLADLKEENEFYRVVERERDGFQKSEEFSIEVNYASDAVSRAEKALMDREQIGEYSAQIVIEGNPFIEANVSDFGTIEAYATWTKREIPSDRSMIVEQLRQLPARFMRTKT
jgi:hypothetical protein